MDGGGLPGSGEDKGLVAVVSILLQILDHRLDPVFMGTCLWTTGNHPKACGQVPGQAFDVLGRQSKAMIRLGAGPGDAGFNDVQPVHLGLGGVVFRGPDPAPGREIGHVAQVPRTTPQEIRIERKDPCSLLEVVYGVDILAKSAARRLADVVRGEGFVLVPPGPGIDLLEILNLGVQGRRHNRFSEQAQPGTSAASRLETGQGAARRGNPLDRQAAQNGVPGRRLPKDGNDLRPVRIVECQDRGLMEEVGGSQAPRMPGIAFDLGRPAQVAFREETDTHAAQGHGGGIEQGPAGHKFFGLLNIGDDLGGGCRCHGTPAQPGQGQRGCHQAEEPPPAEGIGPDVRLRGKFPRISCWKTSVPANSSRLRQYFFPWAEARSAWRVASSWASSLRGFIGGTRNSW